MRGLLVGLLLGAGSALAQSVTTVEVYGAVPALQAYNGLGTNITQTNAWEYAAAQAAHITWGRNDCPWQNTEQSAGVYSIAGGCATALANSSTYGVHPVFNADYGPYSTNVAAGTATSAISIGATTATITVTSGSLASVVPGQTELGIPSGFISTKHSYPGVLVTAVAGSTLTLASAATTAVASGTALQLNKLLYPPVLVTQSSYSLNPSVQAYGNYAHYLAQQIAAAGLTGQVSLWNEPPWSDDAWDDGSNLYDTVPATLTNIDPGAPGLGMELPFYAGNYITPVAGVSFDNGYTETAGFVGSIYFPNWTLVRPNPKTINAVFGSQSLHPYGNNPEDAGWIGNACLYAQGSNFNNVYANCTPTGAVVGAASKTAVAATFQPYAFGGMRTEITETGTCRCNTPTPSETQVSRFDLRQFLMFQALGVTPVMFYRLYGDSNWQWFTSQGNPLPVYTAFQNLMTDIGTISSTPVAPYSPCMMPRVSSFTGYYPLATGTLVGAQAGNKANSLLYYTWQRSYSSNWNGLASPTAVNVSVAVPAGLTVSSVKDTVTAATVSYTFSAQTLTYPVTDDPIEVLMVPNASSTPAMLSCT